MSNSPTVVLFGRLGANPELKYTPKQEPICTFSIAENIQGSERPVWHKVVVWGKNGEDCNLHLKKGSPVFVRGQKVIKKYQTEDGLKTYEEVNAETVGFPWSR